METLAHLACTSAELQRGRLRGKSFSGNAMSKLLAVLNVAI
jgi:hypothetical protein